MQALDLLPPLTCVMQVAQRYALPPRMLLAVLLTEGGHSGSASHNRNGTVDLGPFQINSTWAERLQRSYGVEPALLRDDLCWSAQGAAYILRYEINRARGDFWQGVGHYHSHTPRLMARYIDAVYRRSLTF